MRIINRIANLTLKLNDRLVMPFTRIKVPNDVLTEYGQAIGNAIQQAMTECFNVDPSDLFQIISGHDAGYMNITPEYKGVSHASPWCLVQITCNNGRSRDTKDAFYTRVAFLISKVSSIESQNVIVSLIEVDSSCWSFGIGIKV